MFKFEASGENAPVRRKHQTGRRPGLGPQGKKFPGLLAAGGGGGGRGGGSWAMHSGSSVVRASGAPGQACALRMSQM